MLTHRQQDAVARDNQTSARLKAAQAHMAHTGDELARWGSMPEELRVKHELLGDALYSDLSDAALDLRIARNLEHAPGWTTSASDRTPLPT